MASVRYRSRLLLASPEAEPVEDACLVVDGDRITYVGSAGASREAGPFEETVDLGRALLLPGFVNTHCHSAMSLFRGMGNGLSLDEWLRTKIWPMEDQLKEDDLVYGNLLSLAEYARSGITSFVDFYNVAPMMKALSKVRMRAVLSLAFMDEVPSMKEESWRRLERVESFKRRVDDGKGMRVPALAVHSAYACSEEMLRGVADAAKENRLLVTGHLVEAGTEVPLVKASTGVGPVALMSRTGILGPRFLAAHCVHLDARGIAKLAQAGSSVSHCPRSNSRLGVGIAPVPKMLRAGLNVSLGTDGAGSSDTADFFEEMRTASYLQRAANSDAALLPPRELLAMATVNGSRALGGPGRGLAAGGDADFIAVRLDGAHLNPVLDLIGNVVFCSRPEDVSITVSGGRVLQRDGEVSGLDLGFVMAKANEIAHSLK